MATRTRTIRRKPQACWRGFTDVDTLCAWVPGLRTARLLARDRNGMPSEVEFEFSESRRYVLAYTYEWSGIARIVRWEPRTAATDAVRGSARFEPCDEGTKLTYELVHGEGRSELERYLASADELVDAFARWMAESAERSSRGKL